MRYSSACEPKIKHLAIVIEEHIHDYPSIPRKRGIAKHRGTSIMLTGQDDNLAYDISWIVATFSS